MPFKKNDYFFVQSFVQTFTSHIIPRKYKDLLLHLVLSETYLSSGAFLALIKIVIFVVLYWLIEPCSTPLILINTSILSAATIL